MSTQPATMDTQDPRITPTMADLGSVNDQGEGPLVGVSEGPGRRVEDASRTEAPPSSAEDGDTQNMPKTTVEPDAPTRFCVRCGSAEGDVAFRSDFALKCLQCDQEFQQERKEYHKRYHRARTAAISRLIDAYPKLFDRIFAEERDRIDREEEDAKQDGKGIKGMAKAS